MRNVLQENKELILENWDRIQKKVSVTTDRIKDGMPYSTVNGVYDDWQDNASWWTNTF